MTALAIYDPFTELLNLSPVETCRFCGCTEANPCTILVGLNPDGKESLARSGNEVLEEISCSWYLEEVCNSPVCLEKLILEWRGEKERAA